MTVVDTTTGEVVASLESCEAVIERSLDAFFEVGAALVEIRDSRLYRQDYATFEIYCRERWGFDRTYAHRLITANEVAGMLPIGNIPANEAQARALASMKDDPDEMVEVWQQANEQAEAEGRRPTAADIKRLADEKRRKAEGLSQTAATCDRKADALDAEADLIEQALPPAPRPLSFEEQKAIDLEQSAKRAARALEQFTDVWHYFRSWHEGRRRDEITAHLLDPTVKALSKIEEYIQ